MNNPRHIFLWLMFLLCFVAMYIAGNSNNYSHNDSTLFSILGREEVPNYHLMLTSGCNVGLQPDYIKCNSYDIHFGYGYSIIYYLHVKVLSIVL
jgi:hypothetical protein